MNFRYPFYPEKGLYRWQGQRFMKQSKTIGILPSFSGFKHFTTSLSIAKGTFRMGEGGGDGNVAHLGLEYTPHNQSIAPKIGYFLTGFAYIFGANIGVNALYHFGPNGSQPIFRPEIGYGLLFMYLNYGRNISFTNDYRSIHKHMFTLSAYFTILPKTKK
ncbi:MAG: hypothetical protein ACPGED_12960 [Flavobacteriales bacterium]